MEHSFLWLVGEWEIRLGNDSSFFHTLSLLPHRHHDQLQAAKTRLEPASKRRRNCKTYCSVECKRPFFFPGFLGGKYAFMGGGFVEVLSWVMWVTVPPKRQQNYLVSFWNPDFSHKVNRHLTITLIFQMQALFWEGLEFPPLKSGNVSTGIFVGSTPLTPRRPWRWYSWDLPTSANGIRDIADEKKLQHLKLGWWVFGTFFLVNSSLFGGRFPDWVEWSQNLKQSLQNLKGSGSFLAF